MPSLNWNKSYWNTDYNWPGHGEEWSEQWGNSATQWNGSILPRIARYFPAKTIVEIAPGQGRWTRFLLNHCKNYYGLDTSEQTTEFCKKYLRKTGTARKKKFIANDGKSLTGIRTGTVDFVFSFDSLVHAEMDVIEDYLVEIRRVLVEGGSAFIHHSNLAMLSGKFADENIHCRGKTVSADLVRAASEKIDLGVRVQEMVSWQSDECQDCFTLFTRSSTEEIEPRLIKNNLFWEDAGRLRDTVRYYND